MEITGQIEHILQVETGTSKAGKDWSKGGVVLNTGDEYNPNICVGLFGDKLELLKGLNVGDEIIASVNISSREYNGKWYTQCDGWKLTKTEGQPAVDAEESQDLPF